MSVNDKSSVAIESRVSVLEASQKATLDELRLIKESIDKVQSTVNKQQKTPWAVVIAAISLIVVLVGAVGSAFIGPLAIGMKHQEDAIGREMGHQKEVQSLTRDLLEAKIGKQADLSASERDSIRKAVAVLEANMDKIALSAASHQEKFKEIDTQIFWVTDVENMHKRHVMQYLGLLWKKTFGEDLPMPIGLTDGPSKIHQ